MDIFRVESLIVLGHEIWYISGTPSSTSKFCLIFYVHCVPIYYQKTRRLCWNLATKPSKSPGIAVVRWWRCTITDLPVVDGNVMKMVVVVSAEETCRSVNKKIKWNSSGLLRMVRCIEINWFQQSDCSFSSTGTTITQATPNHNSVIFLTRLVGCVWLGVIETIISFCDWQFAHRWLMVAVPFNKHSLEGEKRMVFLVVQLTSTKMILVGHTLCPAFRKDVNQYAVITIA